MPSPLDSSRRGFFKTLGLTGAGILMAREVLFAKDKSADENDEPEPSKNLAAKGEVPRRQFGRHKDVAVSALALGGHTFATASTRGEAIRIVQEAIDNGITFMDNAWEYHDGKSEELMGEGAA